MAHISHRGAVGRVRDERCAVPGGSSLMAGLSAEEDLAWRGGSSLQHCNLRWDTAQHVDKNIGVNDDRHEGRLASDATLVFEAVLGSAIPRASCAERSAESRSALLFTLEPESHFDSLAYQFRNGHSGALALGCQ